MTEIRALKVVYYFRRKSNHLNRITQKIIAFLFFEIHFFDYISSFNLLDGSLS